MFPVTSVQKPLSEDEILKRSQQIEVFFAGTLKAVKMPVLRSISFGRNKDNLNLSAHALVPFTKRFLKDYVVEKGAAKEGDRIDYKRNDITKLQFQYNWTLTFADLEFVSKAYPKLLSLDLSNTHMKDDALFEWIGTALAQLKQLRIDGDAVSEEKILQLPEGLEVLMINSWPAWSFDFGSLFNHFKNLKTLALFGMRGDMDALVNNLPTRLVSLDIGNSPVEANHVDTIKERCKTLEVLRLMFCHNLTTLGTLSFPSTLRELYLHYSNVEHNVSLEAFKDCLEVTIFFNHEKSLTLEKGSETGSLKHSPGNPSQ